MAIATRNRLVKIDIQGTIKRSRISISRGMADTAVEMSRAITKVLGRQGTSLLRSRPGEPPRRQTGFLQANTSIEKAKGKLQVRVPQYGIWLDGGTGRMAARPFIRVTIHDKRRFWQRRINANIRKHAK